MVSASDEYRKTFATRRIWQSDGSEKRGGEHLPSTAHGEGIDVAKNWRRLRCPPEAVFQVLADGWLYPSWVVGASRMRDVDDTWPEEGSKLRHSVGVWPMLLDDSTSVCGWDPPRRMVLRARGWPIGEASVTILVEPRGEECIVRMTEYAVRGPGRLVPKWLADAVIGWRNRETLHRLAYLAEGGAR